MNFGLVVGWHSIYTSTLKTLRDVSGVYYLVFTSLLLLPVFFSSVVGFRCVAVLCVFSVIFCFVCHVSVCVCVCLVVLFFRLYVITAMCAELNMITAFKQLQFHTKLVTTASVTTKIAATANYSLVRFSQLFFAKQTNIHERMNPFRFVSLNICYCWSGCFLSLSRIAHTAERWYELIP